jgi:hypothetical protein
MRKSQPFRTISEAKVFIVENANDHLRGNERLRIQPFTDDPNDIVAVTTDDEPTIICRYQIEKTPGGFVVKWPIDLNRLSGVSDFFIPPPVE